MSEDLIRRSDAIETAYQLRHKPNDAEWAEWLKAFNAIPSADRPKGEWIMHIDDLFPCESTQECSICHAEQFINGNDDNFCPNCGAEMKGADDE